MNKYFFFSGSDNVNEMGFAYPESEQRLPHQLISEMREKTELPFNLILKKVVYVNNKHEGIDDLLGIKYLWVDYQPNFFVWPLMSERLMIAINECLTGEEGIIWMKVKVLAGGESRYYYIPRFKGVLDVLDMEQTVFVKGTDHIVKPCFSSNKIKSLSVFHKPGISWEIPHALYINERLKNIIVNKGFTGVYIKETKVA